MLPDGNDKDGSSALWERVNPAVPLDEQMSLLPEQPGVYIFRNADGNPLYVGKARSLKHRVRSYFQPSAAQSERIRNMVSQIRAIEHISTDNEVEALILESNLIKRYRPKYNVSLRDDKSFPYLEISIDEPWPRVAIVRGPKKKGARYFGPYTSAGALRETLRTLRPVFPYRSCSNARLNRGRRACLYLDLKRCLGPCTGELSSETYAEMIEELCLFLEGRRDGIARRLRRSMQEAADALEFEKAARFRDQLVALERMMEKQKIVSPRSQDEDVIGFARRGDKVWVQVFFIREGKITGREQFILERAAELNDAEVSSAFIKQFYHRAVQFPDNIVIQAKPEDAGVIADWLARRKGGRVRLISPGRGERRRLMEMVRDNARRAMEIDLAVRARDAADNSLRELAAILDLEAPPRRIECYDVSNFQGSEATGSMVVFTEGRPDRAGYRKFKVKGVSGADDCAMLREVLFRRFSRSLRATGDADASGETGSRRDGAGFGIMPDLLVVDGGKGQLGAALQVLRELGLIRVPVVGLAKKEEEVFVPGHGESLVLPRESSALKLLQRIRDEAHRFALSYHRQLRTKKSVASSLETVPGIGAKRREALYRNFGSLERMKEASIEELASVPGMNRLAATELLKHFRREK